MSTESRNHRKTQRGTVISNKMDKTVIVSVKTVCSHPIYKKVITRSKKYYAHNEGVNLKIGQEVTIIETRPLSKTKRWRVVEASAS